MKKEKLLTFDNFKRIIPYAGFILIVVVFTFTTDGRFLTVKNMRIILTQAMITMVAAVGTTFVMAHNNLDFSLGGGCALCAVVAFLVTGGENIPLIFLCCVGMGLFCGLCTALIHIKGRIPAFMAGMCIMFIGRGTVDVLIMKNGTIMKVKGDISHLANIYFYLFVLVLVVLAGYFLFNRTKVGKYQKLIGSNPVAAKLSGINVDKYKLFAFLISGATLGIASFLTLIRLGSLTATVGQNLETDVLISLCLGGMSMSGGSTSSIRGAIIGPLSYFMLANGMTLWGVDPHLVYVVKAGVFLLMAFITVDRSRSKVVI